MVVEGEGREEGQEDGGMDGMGWDRDGENGMLKSEQNDMKRD
jgi:hypothetical protein